MSRKSYINIYVILLVSVLVSALLSYFGHTKLALVGIFTVALIKATLVLAFYMHLKTEQRWVRWMLGSAVACLVILFVGLIPDIVHVYGRMGG